MDSKNNGNMLKDEPVFDHNGIDTKRFILFENCAIGYSITYACVLCKKYCLGIQSTLEHPSRCAGRLRKKVKEEKSEENSVSSTRIAAMKRHKVNCNRSSATVNGPQSEELLKRVKIEKQEVEAIETEEDMNRLSEDQPSTSEMGNVTQVSDSEASTSKEF